MPATTSVRVAHISASIPSTAVLDVLYPYHFMPTTRVRMAHTCAYGTHVCVWHTRVRMAHTLSISIHAHNACAYGTHVCVWHTRVRMAHTCAYGTHFIHIISCPQRVCVWHTRVRMAHTLSISIMPTTRVRMAHTCAYGTHFIHIISCPQHVFRVGQNCIYTPYMTVYLVISLPKLPYIHRIYMVLANPTRVRMAHAAAHIPSSLQALYTSQ